MKQKLLYVFFITGLISCGSNEKAEDKKTLEANMSEVDSIQDLSKIDSLGEELGDLNLEIEARKAELDSLLKEAEKEENE